MIGEKNKLKTLEDLMEIYEMKGIVPLREEAIKWIKELYIFPSPSDEVEMEAQEFITGTKIKYSEEGKHAIINFIKYFFNITEEDLK